MTPKLADWMDSWMGAWCTDAADRRTGPAAGLLGLLPSLEPLRLTFLQEKVTIVWKDLSLRALRAIGR